MNDHYSREVTGEERAMAIASALTRECTWFEVTPFPDDDRWRFAVKDHRKPTLDYIVDRTAVFPARG